MAAPRHSGPTGRRNADDDGFAVRPYALTGGRVRHASAASLPVEALVQAIARPTVSDTPERRRILEMCSDQFESVAELAAHLRLPLGVVRVLVGDMLDNGQVRVHGLTAPTSSPSISLTVLESVLDGISSL